MIDVDIIPLSFGKYEGKTPKEVAEIDEGYIVWMYDNVTPKYCTKELRDYCEMDIREQEDIINENRYDIY
jgi:uncharacterized protein (DUF3820 family)